VGGQFDAFLHATTGANNQHEVADFGYARKVENVPENSQGNNILRLKTYSQCARGMNPTIVPNQLRLGVPTKFFVDSIEGY